MFKPSPQQQAVADWVQNSKGHLNLIARAGCGKTSTLLWCVPKLNGSTLFLAFNKSIALEIKTKLNSQGIDWKQCEGATFHSIGFRAWKKVAPTAQVNDKKVELIIKGMANAELGTGSRKFFMLEDGSRFLCQLISLAKQQALGHLHPVGDDAVWSQLIDHHGLEHDTDGTEAEMIALAKAIYNRSIELNKIEVDFDDMLLAPLVGKCRFWQYDWVLVDEAQDTNPARRALALCLLKRTGRLIAVGDPCQAIYGFTGADAKAMDVIADQLGSATLPLNITYRCPKAVVAHANAIVPDIIAHDSAPEGSVVRMPFYIDERNPATPCFEHLIDGLSGDDAILCRNTKPLIQLAYSLLGRGKGCQVEGRDIGNGLIALATKWKKTKGIKALKNKLEAYASTEIQKAVSKGMDSKAQMIEDKVDALLVICDHIGDDGLVSDLVAQINSLFGDTREGQKPNVVTLCTVHKSKGREWQRVFILDRAKLMPSRWAKKDWQNEQEANLIYVAITRSKHELIEVDGLAE